MENTEKENFNFIEKIINKDAESGVKIITRFPPEPNGFLHLGHVKSICLNFGMAKKYNGKCNLRFDDTNPEKESDIYIKSIEKDVKWLGFEYGKALFASDYYDEMYKTALKLIKEGKAYVDSLSAEEIKQTRGTLTEKGKESPSRNKSVEENLREFENMKNGKFEEGSRVLRAKIDMSSPNINMRDPVIYRIRYSEHPRTGKKWCIYPMYDLAHSIEDAVEGITHSLCTLEFEDHRPLYDWVVENDTVEHRPRQIEFSRLNVNYMLMSKRKLLYLVENRIVDGWDDPRLPTIAGLRRRGYTPESLRNFVSKVGIGKVEGVVDYSLLEFSLREDLNKRADRLFAIINPVKVVIDNYPADKTEYIEVENNPEDENAGKRELPFTREIFIERSDFSENPPKGYFRLAMDKEVRLKGGYYIKAVGVEKNKYGLLKKIHAVYDPQSAGGTTPDGRKVKGTIHWLSAKHVKKAEIRLYEKLFKESNPGEKTGNYLDDINPCSLKKITGYVEEKALFKNPGEPIQFVRNGYFTKDSKYSTKNHPVFNRSVTLKDSWAKEQEKNKGEKK